MRNISTERTQRYYKLQRTFISDGNRDRHFRLFLSLIDIAERSDPKISPMFSTKYCRNRSIRGIKARH